MEYVTRTMTTVTTVMTMKTAKMTVMTTMMKTAKETSTTTMQRWRRRRRRRWWWRQRWWKLRRRRRRRRWQRWRRRRRRRWRWRRRRWWRRRRRRRRRRKNVGVRLYNPELQNPWSNSCQRQLPAIFILLFWFFQKSSISTAEVINYNLPDSFGKVNREVSFMIFRFLKGYSFIQRSNPTAMRKILQVCAQHRKEKWR